MLVLMLVLMLILTLILMLITISQVTACSPSLYGDGEHGTHRLLDQKPPAGLFNQDGVVVPITLVKRPVRLRYGEPDDSSILARSMSPDSVPEFGGEMRPPKI
jgi:hypothetical protein